MREVIVVDKGLIIGLIPMWMQADTADTEHGVNGGRWLFDDWLLRRQRINQWIGYLNLESTDIMLWSNLVAQPFSGGESESKLLQFGSARSELWQNISLSAERFHLSSSFMIRPSESLLMDSQLPATLLWQDSAISLGSVQAFGDYAMAAGFIYDGEPLLVVLVHLSDSSGEAAIKASISKLMAAHRRYCYGRLVVAGHMVSGNSWVKGLSTDSLGVARFGVGGYSLSEGVESEILTEVSFPQRPSQASLERFFVPKSATVASSSVWPHGSLNSWPGAWNGAVPGLIVELAELPSCQMDDHDKNVSQPELRGG